MKFFGMIILIYMFLLLNKTQAQTASSKPVTDYYSVLVKEKLDAGEHPARSNSSKYLPSESEVPIKAKEYAKNLKPAHNNGETKKLPGDARVNIDEIKERNKKWIK